MTKILEVKNSFSSNEDGIEVLLNTSSKGAQEKWFNPNKNIYLKKDFNGYESLSEIVVSNILFNCTTIDKKLLVRYELCDIDGVSGCYSKNFRDEYEDEISLRRIMKLKAKSDAELYLTNDASQNLKIITNSLFDFTGKDFTKELKLIFAVDSFFLNVDRHAANLSILVSEDSCRISPIFDNGMSLLSNLNLYPNGVNVNVFKHDAHAYLPSKSFKNNALLYDLEPFISEKLLKDFIISHRSEIPRICKLLESQLKENHLQHLLIKEDSNINKSNIFGVK